MLYCSDLAAFLTQSQHSPFIFCGVLKIDIWVWMLCLQSVTTTHVVQLKHNRLNDWNRKGKIKCWEHLTNQSCSALQASSQKFRVLSNVLPALELLFSPWFLLLNWGARGKDPMKNPLKDPLKDPGCSLNSASVTLWIACSFFTFPKDPFKQGGW